MKIVVIGTRGIPNILGGVETHCEELYPRIASQGHNVTIIRRSCYISPTNKLTEYKGINLIDIFAPHKKSLEAIIHTFLAIVKARTLNPDIVHIHAIGPSILVPLARILGLKVVMTNHGPDYDRQKWGKLAKLILKIGESMGSRFANEVIVISPTIQNIIAERYGRTDSHLIFNGVTLPIKSNNTDYINELQLLPQKYILALGRFVKEKGFDLLIDAFNSINTEHQYTLVLAGDADHEDTYSLQLKEKAKRNNVVLTGFIKGEKLNQIMTNAYLFVLPSYHEGLPISLLEAMSYNIDVLVSDISANQLPELSHDDFFKCGSVESLKAELTRKISNIKTNRQYNLANYNWDTIAQQVISVYKKP
ncbi:MAG: glycosyltransferase family 4 protein [Muribaculaceae bacterium]